MESKQALTFTITAWDEKPTVGNMTPERMSMKVEYDFNDGLHPARLASRTVEFPDGATRRSLLDVLYDFFRDGETTVPLSEESYADATGTP